jgi:hypothetical protein
MPTAMEKKLWELLLEDEIITSDQLEVALERQKESGTSLVRTLIDMGAVTEWEMAATLGKQLNVPFITLSHYEIDKEVLESIPEEIVRKYQIVPVDKTGRRSDDRAGRSFQHLSPRRAPAAHPLPDRARHQLRV